MSAGTLTTHRQDGGAGVFRVEFDGATIGAAMQWPGTDEWRISRGEGVEHHIFGSLEEAAEWLREEHQEQAGA